MAVHSWCVCQTYMYLSSGLTGKDSWLIQVQGVESLGGCADNSGNWKGVWGRGKTNSKPVCSDGWTTSQFCCNPTFPLPAHTLLICTYHAHTHTTMHV